MKKLILSLIFLGVASSIAMANVSFNFGLGYQFAVIRDLHNKIPEKIKTDIFRENSYAIMPYGASAHIGLGWGFLRNNLLSAGAELSSSVKLSVGRQTLWNTSNQLRLYFALRPAEVIALIPFGGFAIENYDYVSGEINDLYTEVYGIRIEFFSLYLEFTNTINNKFNANKGEVGFGFSFRDFF